MKFYGLVDKENKIWIGDTTIPAMLRSGKFKNADDLELKDLKHLCKSTSSAETHLRLYKMFMTEKGYTEKEQKKLKDIGEAILACQIKEINIEINIK